MSSLPSIHTVESHTEGMPTRIVVDGLPTIPEGSMTERFTWADLHWHGLRKLLIHEPRGHAAMFGAILLPAARADADYGVIYMSASGFLPMCGHGTIGVATMLVERQMIQVTEPVTTIRLDTPAGLVQAHVRVQDGKAQDVTFTNVPAFVLATDLRLELPGWGSAMADIAYGGNFYALCDIAQFDRHLDVQALNSLTDLGLAVIEAARRAVPIQHPHETEPTRLRAAILSEPAQAGRPARNLMVKEPRYFDRSPCGTGTCARMALEFSRGRLALQQPFVHESILGTRFEGRLVDRVPLGDIDALVPEITGRAWITGQAQFTLDPTDPYPHGFSF